MEFPISRLVELRATNVKRLRAVTIRPDPDSPATEITGANSEGKSSVLDSIAYALGGVAMCPDRPIRDGEERAEIVCRIEPAGLTVTRTFTRAKGCGYNSRIEVTDPDGTARRSPQAVLDALIGPETLAFDPLAFARMKPKEQRDILLRVLGLADTLAKIDAEYDAAYAARTLANRAVDTINGGLMSLATVPPPDDTPDAPLSSAALADELAAAQRYESETADAAKAVRETADAATEARGDLDRLNARAVSLKAELADIERRAVEQAEFLRGVEAARDRAIAALGAREAAKPDIADIRRRIASIDATNSAVARKAAIAAKRGELSAARKAAEAREVEVSEIARRKADMLRGAKFPIAGLGFDADGVTYRGVPVAQASTSEQIRLGFAIMAKAYDRPLKLMRIYEGSLLDAKSRAALYATAAEYGYQLVVERVDESGAVGIVIEDGMVKS